MHTKKFNQKTYFCLIPNKLASIMSCQHLLGLSIYSNSELTSSAIIFEYKLLNVPKYQRILQRIKQIVRQQIICWIFERGIHS